MAKKETVPRTLVIVTGARAKLGEAYLRALAKNPKVKCIGTCRSELPDDKESRFISVDLLQKAQVNKKIENIDLQGFKEVILIHPVGMFKFEMFDSSCVDRNNDGIDDEVFASNVVTFLYIFKALKKKVEKSKKVRFTVCAFGSISDKYQVPFWQSYTKSKDFLRNMIKKNISRNKNLRGIFVNVSTTDTGNERNLRPFSNKRYWLKPKEIVQISLPIILSKKDVWTELNIYKPNPKFDSTWYTNHEDVLQRWKKQMRKN